MGMKSLVEAIRMFNLYKHAYLYLINFIHGVQTHQKHLELCEYSKQINHLQLNMLPLPNLFKINYKDFLQINLRKKRAIEQLQNIGVEKVSSLIWLFQKTFEPI